MVMDIGWIMADQEVCVQAAVGIQQMPGSLKQESFLVVNKDSNRLIFINKADKGMQEGCFTIDGVFSLDTGQDKLFLDQLQPLLAMVPFGYSVSLLVCETHHYEPRVQIQAFVQKVIESALQESSPPKNSARYLQTISFVLIYTDGKAQDLLSPGSQVLQVMDLPPLGLVIEDATEIVVADAQAATQFYLQGVSLYQSYLQQSFQKQHKAICGNLLSITMETKAESQGLQRATVKIFAFSGEDEQPCANLFSPLYQASSTVPLPADAGFLSWILKHLLEESALTFLLLCLTLPDASGEEILSALSLTEQVRAVAKRVAPTYWDPIQEAQKRRAVIGELRAQLSFSSWTEQESMISQLGRMIKELQVLKSQSWGKKKETSAYEMKDTCLEARGQILSEMDDGDELVNQQSQDNTHQDKETSGGGSTPKIHLEQVGVEEGVTEENPFTVATYRARDLDGATQTPSPSLVGEQHQDTKVRFSQAKARSQFPQEQHHLLIQQELLRMEEELAGQELPPGQHEALLWQKEKSLLILRMEALQREQAEAERDLEELYQEHLHETETQKQHILQVFQAYRRHAEEQIDALELKYRKLLQESLQDAILLSTQNQQLRAQKQLGCMEKATQTDLQYVT
ncbi:uncharacterized protein LOC133365152 [Rhineura floridana]|uniref:uncharacterized protein LOC133365152 n=1 Tax=Rhineura floridana TaxID=261503 RepID=UPI002AC86AE3|nr:uncharacterized protein LOC133365152 [Rhineura floridana]